MATKQQPLSTFLAHGRTRRLKGVGGGEGDEGLEGAMEGISERLVRSEWSSRISQCRSSILIVDNVANNWIREWTTADRMDWSLQCVNSDSSVRGCDDNG